MRVSYTGYLNRPFHFFGILSTRSVSYVSRVCVALMLAELVHRTEWFVVSYFFLVLNHQTGMSCGNPPSISNGNLVYNNTSYNSTAHYSCNEGYNLNTAPVKRCTAKKRWEGLTPRCCEYTFAVRSSCKLNCWSILWGGGNYPILASRLHAVISYWEWWFIGIGYAI